MQKLEQKQIDHENDQMGEAEREQLAKKRKGYEEGSEMYKKYDFIEAFTEDDEFRLKEVKKELKGINPKFMEVEGNINHLCHKLMMQKLSDILSSDQLSRKFIQANDKEDGIVILKPAKHNSKATFDGKNKKQKSKVQRMKEISSNIDDYSHEDAVETY